MSERRPLALIGFMGSGKSTVGRLVADAAGATHVDLDDLIEEREGMPITALFRARGEDAFRAIETELLSTALTAGHVVSLGGGAPLAENNWTVIRARATSVWLEAPLETVLERCDVPTRPLLQGRSEEELRRLFDSRLARYGEADHRIDATRDPGVVAEEVLHLWLG
ncbi:MAG TPA: shikimate kinase [Candidatus Dormibacteraeota bacterium]|jgi:shikimate kinase|nr:shikimate kinase [Candidatus Dormibacteraeota bacterium]